jgi:hypothetical protein
MPVVVLIAPPRIFHQAACNTRLPRTVRLAARLLDCTPACSSMFLTQLLENVPPEAV